jgi:flavin-dependent dehydrogenase
MSTSYDAIVIGTGQAGPSLAGRLAGAGMRVAVVERHLFGGIRQPCTVIQRAVHIHPTVSELIPTLLGDLKPLDGVGGAEQGA